MVLTLLKIYRQLISPVFNPEEMKYCWKVDMQQFLDEEGCIDPYISRSSAIMAKYFGEIVKTASNDATFGPVFSGIDCRRRPHRYACRGKLEIIYIDYLKDGEIFWRCPACRDKGIITGWEGSCWDLMSPEFRFVSQMINNR